MRQGVLLIKRVLLRLWSRILFFSSDRSIDSLMRKQGDYIFLASEAKTIGWGGREKVSKATGVSSDTISKGCKELEDKPEIIESGKIRKPGGGRKKLVDTDPTLLSDLDNLIEPTARGDPESPLRWTCKSTRKLARELKNMGHNISHMTEMVNSY